MMPLLRTSENPDEIFLENFLLFFSLVQYDKVEIWAKKSREYGYTLSIQTRKLKKDIH